MNYLEEIISIPFFPYQFLFGIHCRPKNKSDEQKAVEFALQKEKELNDELLFLIRRKIVIITYSDLLKMKSSRRKYFIAQELPLYEKEVEEAERIQQQQQNSTSGGSGKRTGMKAFSGILRSVVAAGRSGNTRWPEK